MRFPRRSLLALVAAVLLIGGALLVRSLERFVSRAPLLGDAGAFSPAFALRFPGGAVRVEVARTEAERIAGLSGRAALPDDGGMLFVFDQDGLHGIWMKDMHFPLDIAWFDASNTLVHLVENARLESFPEVFRPSQPARFVLELPAGGAARVGLRTGEQFSTTTLPE